ncbi:MAG TPA: response regulator transcription factor [Chitinophagaceae bacterium]|mgnify:CR=1 FL=1|nr:response regulator transcription factor [Chitinophagaceae bacterium]
MLERQPIPVAIFENNEAYRASLELYFLEFPGIEVAGSYADAVNAAQKVIQADASLVLMDIDMPGINGIQATAAIKEACTAVIVLILTVFEDNDRIFDAIRAGADGYLLKSTPPHEIVKAVQDAIAGGSPMTPAVARKVLRFFYSGSIKEKPSGPASHLTEKEKEVLGLLVEGNSYKMIGENLQISVDTVRFHIRNIYAKLHVNSATEAVALAIRKKMI